MARATINPTIFGAQTALNLAAQNITALAAAGTAPGVGAGNGVQFMNFPGQTLLLVSVGVTVTTPTIAIGTTLYGQASAGIVMSALTASALSIIGPFFSVEELQLAGTSGLIAVDFSSATSILCSVIQLGGTS